MTVYEALSQKRDLLIQAALACSISGKHAMCDVWCNKALAIVTRLMSMNLKEASQPYDAKKVVESCLIS